ncbi:MAG: GtrA family protein [Oscillospiraceae bacterium]|jgi:putative flippase GtrA|nr:GtrA family protein [Oscillospiraceae bacterium]
MAKKCTLIKKLLNRETILYIVFGLVTTVVNFGFYWGAQKLFAAFGWQGVLHLFDGSKSYDYLDANTIAWVAAVLFAFVTNKLFVFESKSWEKKTTQREFLSFVAARVVSLGIDQGLMFLLVSVLAFDVWAGGILIRIWDTPLTHRTAEFMETYSFLAKCIVQVVIVALNYVFSKLFIFKKR